MLVFFSGREAGAQQLLYDQDKLFSDGIARLVMVDSSSAIALGGYDDYTLRMVDFYHPGHTRALLDYKVETMAYNARFGLIAAVPYDDYENPGHEKRIRIIDTGGTQLHIVPPQREVAFSADGSLLFGIDAYDHLRAYRLHDGSVADSLAWDGNVYELIPDSANGLLVYGERQGQEKVWQWEPPGVPAVLYESGHEISAVLPTPGFTVIAEKVEKIEYHNRVRITVLSPEGTVLQQWEEEQDAQRLTLSTDGRYLAAADYLDELVLWERAAGQFRRVEQGIDDIDARELYFAGDRMLLALGYHEVSFFSLDNMAVMQTLELSDYERSFSGASGVAADGRHFGFAFTDGDFEGGMMAVRFDGNTAVEAATRQDRPGMMGPARAAVVLQSGHQNAISSTVFGRSGDYLFSSDEDGMLIKWDLRSGLHYEPVDLFGEDEVFSGGYTGEDPLDLAYNSSLNHLAVSSDNNVSLAVLDAETMYARFTLPANFIPRHPAYSPDGRFLAFEVDHRIKIYRAGPARYELLHTVPVQAQVNDLSFDLNSALLAAAMIDNSVKIINVASGAVSRTLNGHETSVTDLAFSPDDRWLYSLDFSSNIRRWHMGTFEGELFYKSTYAGSSNITVEDGQLYRHLKVSDIAFGTDPRHLYSTGHAYKNTADMKPVNSILEWDTQTKTQIDNFEISAASGIINTLAASADGRLLVTGGLDQQLRLWNTEADRLQSTYGNVIPEITDAIPLYEEQLVLSTTSESEDFYRLQRWDLPGLRIEESLDGVKYGTDNLVFDPERGRVGTEFVNTITWMTFDEPADSVSFRPEEFYGHMHPAPEGQLIFGYNTEAIPGEAAYSNRKKITIDVYDTATRKKRYTIATTGIVRMNYTNLVPRFDTRRMRFALQTGPDELTLYNYHTGAEMQVIRTEEAIRNAQFSGSDLYLWHDNAVGRLRPGGDREEIVYTFTDPLRDEAGNRVAAGPGRLAWISESEEGLQVGRTLSFVMQLYDPQQNSGRQIPVDEVPQKLFFTDGGRKVAAVFKNYLSFYDAYDGRLLVSMVPVGTDDYFFYTPDFYYSSSRNAYRAVGFRYQNKMISFDQLDLWYNRPDIVMQQLQMTGQDDIELVYEAYTKRLAQAGFDPAADPSPDLSTLPSIRLDQDLPLTSRDKTITLEVSAADTLHSLASLHVYANGVPVGGRKGTAVSGDRYEGELEVELMPGINKLQVSARNVAGFESLRETVEIEYVPDAPVASDLYLLSINVSDYLSDNDLQYARKDGQDLVALYGGRQAPFYNEVHIDTLFDRHATLERILKLKDKLMQTRPEDRVVLFVSGHGLLDDDFNFYFATYDTDFTHPAGRGISYDQIEWLLDGIPARRKLLLIDACHSGEVDREELAGPEAAPLAENVVTTFEGAKGVGSITTSSVGLQNSFELMQQLFANLNRGSGAVVISAAAGDSFALESDEWQNGVFTYAILNGLKNLQADADGDEQITVSELRSYVYAKVVEETGGRQKPTTRQENLEYDFRVW